MTKHTEIDDEQLRKLIKAKEIRLGGNNKLKIFGTLNCNSGKRMKKQNRVFFVSEKEAVEQGFRPCGHCLNAAYKKWKDELIRK
jgi:methylphosphotriester-DNA--protein-cysteine methyltransferase